MRRRPSARILLLDEERRVLLFEFEYRKGSRAGQSFWATPGGAIEAGESPLQAARRELAEELGILVGDFRGPFRCKEFILKLPDGEKVVAQEYFFAAVLPASALPFYRRACWAAEGIARFRWWSAEEIRSTKEVIYPENLAELLLLAEASVLHR